MWSGLDGFNFAFIKEFWYLMKDEMCIMFDHFHGNKVVPRYLLTYFVDLIPKLATLFTLKDFQPISY